MFIEFLYIEHFNTSGASLSSKQSMRTLLLINPIQSYACIIKYFVLKKSKQIANIG